AFFCQRIAMTEPAGLHFDADLPRSRLRDLSLDQLQRPAGLAHLHCTHDVILRTCRRSMPDECARGPDRFRAALRAVGAGPSIDRETDPLGPEFSWRDSLRSGAAELPIRRAVVCLLMEESGRRLFSYVGVVPFNDQIRPTE